MTLCADTLRGQRWASVGLTGKAKQPAGTWDHPHHKRDGFPWCPVGLHPSEDYGVARALEYTAHFRDSFASLVTPLHADVNNPHTSSRSPGPLRRLCRPRRLLLGFCLPCASLNSIDLPGKDRLRRELELHRRRIRPREAEFPRCSGRDRGGSVLWLLSQAGERKRVAPIVRSMALPYYPYSSRLEFSLHQPVLLVPFTLVSRRDVNQGDFHIPRCVLNLISFFSSAPSPPTPLTFELPFLFLGRAGSGV